MSASTTVVINCAGMGSRLGFGHPKALLEVAGKPIIHHHLDALEGFDDIRIVIGYEANQMINTVLSYRKDVIFVFNHKYRETNTLASLSLGARHGRDYVVSVDGDLLLAPGELQKFIDYDGNILGITPAYSDEAVYVEVGDGDTIPQVRSFNRKEGAYEWTGLVKIDARYLKYNTGHVYHALEQVLPIPAMEISCREIDTPSDYENAILWASSVFKEKS